MAASGGLVYTVITGMVIIIMVSTIMVDSAIILRIPVSEAIMGFTVAKGLVMEAGFTAVEATVGEDMADEITMNPSAGQATRR